MIERLRAWWQRSKGPLEVIFVSAFLVGLVVLIVLIILGYRNSWDWTGLGPVNSEPKQHMKTLWDWLQLLIIPAVLAVGGYVSACSQLSSIPFHITPSFQLLLSDPAASDSSLSGIHRALSTW